jgi:hypothetical protein
VTYRLITVWKDEESTAPDHIARSAVDFSTLQEVEAHVFAAKEMGVIRVQVDEPRLTNGRHLVMIFVPIHQIISWYVWLAPDSEMQEATK